MMGFHGGLSTWYAHSSKALLEEMEQQGLILGPIDVAFTSILSACNHVENIEEGYDCIEHYN